MPTAIAPRSWPRRVLPCSDSSPHRRHGPVRGLPLTPSTLIADAGESPHSEDPLRNAAAAEHRHTALRGEARAARAVRRCGPVNGTSSEMLYSRVGTGAAVRTVHLAAPAADEDQASAGAQSALTALLPSWKAAVPLPLSRSMPSSGDAAGGLRSRATAAFQVPATVSVTTRETPAADEARPRQPSADDRFAMAKEA